ncbi:hypothetical protein AB0H76_34095 [Nocardia sp. NPDC050712]|uniref:hypothetical protein n=1 Tax=Nocardia sp. NPDC050712 TaxID=3155518 RepID=UPI0033CB6A80
MRKFALAPSFAFALTLSSFALAGPAAAQPAPVDAPASSGSSDALYWIVRCVPFGHLLSLSSGYPNDGNVDFCTK